MLMKIFFEISSYSQYLSRCQLMYAFSDSLSCLVIISYFWARKSAPHNLTWENHHVKHHVNFHLFNSFLFLFPFGFFLYFTKLVSLEISAMCACKLSLHQNGLKGRIWFWSSLFFTFFFLTASLNKSFQFQFPDFVLHTSIVHNIVTSKMAAAFKVSIVKEDNRGQFCSNKMPKHRKCVSDIMKNKHPAYISQNFKTSVSKTWLWEETCSSALLEKCTMEVNLSPSLNNCGKTGLVTPQFYSMYTPYYIQLWIFFHS